MRLIGFVLHFSQSLHLLRLCGSASFLRLQQPLHRPIDLSVHPLFVSQDPFHVLFRQKRVAIEAHVGTLILNSHLRVVHWFEGFFDLRDAAQKLMTVKVHIN